MSPRGNKHAFDVLFGDRSTGKDQSRRVGAAHKRRKNGTSRLVTIALARMTRRLAALSSVALALGYAPLLNTSADASAYSYKSQDCQVSEAGTTCYRVAIESNLVTTPDGTQILEVNATTRLTVFDSDGAPEVTFSSHHRQQVVSPDGTEEVHIMDRASLPRFGPDCVETSSFLWTEAGGGFEHFTLSGCVFG